MSTQNLRKHERHRVHFKLVYDDGVSYCAGFVSDISESGLFLEIAEPLPVGTVIELKTMASVDEVLADVKARVVRCTMLEDGPLSIQDPDTGKYNALAGIGVEFQDLDAAGRDAVATMIQKLKAQRASMIGTHDPFLGVKVPHPVPNVWSPTGPSHEIA